MTRSAKRYYFSGTVPDPEGMLGRSSLEAAHFEAILDAHAMMSDAIRESVDVPDPSRSCNEAGKVPLVVAFRDASIRNG